MVNRDAVAQVSSPDLACMIEEIKENDIYTTMTICVSTMKDCKWDFLTGG